MNITVLANRDLPSVYALNLLLPELAQAHRLRLFLSSHVGGQSDMPRELVELAFFEQRLFNELLFPALAASTTQGSLLGFEALGERFDCEVCKLNRVNSPKGLARLREEPPDVILSIRYGGILREKAIAAARLGVLNLHSGVLPEYRGVMATFRAMLAGEKEIGTTLHFIDDAGIDTGRIITRARRQTDAERSYLWNVLQLYPDGVRAMLKAVERLAAGDALAAAPQGTGGAYYTFPTPADLQAFRDAGLRLYELEEILEFSQNFLPNL